MPNRTDLYHYDREQVERHLRDALDIVADLDPPDDLRAQAFTLATTMLSQKQAIFEALAPSGLALPRPLQ